MVRHEIRQYIVIKRFSLALATSGAVGIAAVQRVRRGKLPFGALGHRRRRGFLSQRQTATAQSSRRWQPGGYRYHRKLFYLFQLIVLL
ncbi:hypothetical protein [Serratia rubidaea]|uniref:hypothetical protein n=1 Tax=Serratia rubidaea TaxID=61652 RepID=UPI001BAFEFA8|nr:hypothetical protein [Serratia rubidaea]